VEDRTFEDFLDDMLSNLRTPEQIWAVARNTRWADRADEARAIAEERRKKIKK
jgi:hypothetical protein